MKTSQSHEAVVKPSPPRQSLMFHSTYDIMYLVLVCTWLYTVCPTQHAGQEDDTPLRRFLQSDVVSTTPMNLRRWSKIYWCLLYRSQYTSKATIILFRLGVKYVRDPPCIGENQLRKNIVCCLYYVPCVYAESQGCTIPGIRYSAALLDLSPYQCEVRVSS